jgi:hypothetical protein
MNYMNKRYKIIAWRRLQNGKSHKWEHLKDPILTNDIETTRKELIKQYTEKDEQIDLLYYE